MLCKPTTNDRWDRRAVELAAYLLRHGHCNVPEVRRAVPCCDHAVLHLQELAAHLPHSTA